MAQAIPFPAEFTLTAIIELNNNFLTDLGTGNFVLQAFIETGSGDPLVLSSLVFASDPKRAGSITAQAAGDSSGDLGILLTLSLPGVTAIPPDQLFYRILLLQKGAARYQDPRKFS